MSPGTREIPLAPLREAFKRSGLSSAELARRLGWMSPDSMRVNRQLGLIPSHDGRSKQYRQTTSYDRALEIAEALGIDPVDLDL